ncbi:MAG: hypothetical protein ABWX58_09050 [Psychrobacillus psychrotolerans]
MTNKPFNERDRKDKKHRDLDNPDVVKTDKESLFDMHDDMKTVDAVPIEELNQKVKDEKNHRKTKDDSSSEERYPD